MDDPRARRPVEANIYKESDGKGFLRIQTSAGTLFYWEITCEGLLKTNARISHFSRNDKKEV
jgi:hypothetical protein